MVSIRQMTPEKMLLKASEHILSTGLDDSAARLGLSNMKYGLAKMHLAQEAFGFEPNAFFIAAPDATVTRNSNRWKSGLGYGGLLVWGDGSQELMVLDVKPNCCGMLVMGLDRLPTQAELIGRFRALHHEKLDIDGINLEWDFGISNHFITIFRVKPHDHAPLHPFAAILHGSGKELRRENPWGDGLYWDWSESLKKKAELFQTPFGSLRLLTGSAAKTYFEFAQLAMEFSQKRRTLIASYLFDTFDVYSNETHQGLLSMNEMMLGVHVMRNTETLLPLTLQAHLPSYLLNAVPNLSADAMRSLRLDNQAKNIGVYDYLMSANILPHGGGYAYPQIESVHSVMDHGQDERYYELRLQAGETKQIIKDVRDLAYTYRGMEVLEQVKRLELGKIAAQLDPIFVLKF